MAAQLLSQLVALTAIPSESYEDTDTDGNGGTTTEGEFTEGEFTEGECTEGECTEGECTEGESTEGECTDTDAEHTDDDDDDDRDPRTTDEDRTDDDGGGEDDDGGKYGRRGTVGPLLLSLRPPGRPGGRHHPRDRRCNWQDRRSSRRAERLRQVRFRHHHRHHQWRRSSSSSEEEEEEDADDEGSLTRAVEAQARGTNRPNNNGVVPDRMGQSLVVRGGEDHEDGMEMSLLTMPSELMTVPSSGFAGEEDETAVQVCKDGDEESGRSGPDRTDIAAGGGTAAATERSSSDGTKIAILSRGEGSSHQLTRLAAMRSRRMDCIEEDRSILSGGDDRVGVGQAPVTHGIDRIRSGQSSTSCGHSNETEVRRNTGEGRHAWPCDPTAAGYAPCGDGGSIASGDKYSEAGHAKSAAGLSDDEDAAVAVLDKYSVASGFPIRSVSDDEMDRRCGSGGDDGGGPPVPEYSRSTEDDVRGEGNENEPRGGDEAEVPPEVPPEAEVEAYRQTILDSAPDGDARGSGSGEEADRYDAQNPPLPFRVVSPEPVVVAAVAGVDLRAAASDISVEVPWPDACDDPHPPSAEAPPPRHDSAPAAGTIDAAPSARWVEREGLEAPSLTCDVTSRSDVGDARLASLAARGSWGHVRSSSAPEAVGEGAEGCERRRGMTGPKTAEEEEEKEEDEGGTAPLRPEQYVSLVPASRSSDNDDDDNSDGDGIDGSTRGDGGDGNVDAIAAGISSGDRSGSFEDGKREDQAREDPPVEEPVPSQPQSSLAPSNDAGPTAEHGGECIPYWYCISASERGGREPEEEDMIHDLVEYPYEDDDGDKGDEGDKGDGRCASMPSAATTEDDSSDGDRDAAAAVARVGSDGGMEVGGDAASPAPPPPPPQEYEESPCCSQRAVGPITHRHQNSQDGGLSVTEASNIERDFRDLAATSRDDARSCASPSSPPPPPPDKYDAPLDNTFDLSDVYEDELAFTEAGEPVYSPGISEISQRLAAESAYVEALARMRLTDDMAARHDAATLIQAIHRGRTARHGLLVRLGVAKRRRWEHRTKTPRVTRIHSDIRRAARAFLRNRAEKLRGAGCMVLAVLRVCTVRIQRWWRSVRWRTRRRRRILLLCYAEAERAKAPPPPLPSSSSLVLSADGYYPEGSVTAIQSFVRCHLRRRWYLRTVLPSVVLLQSYFRASIYRNMYAAEMRLRRSYSTSRWEGRRRALRARMLAVSGLSRELERSFGFGNGVNMSNVSPITPIATPELSIIQRKVGKGESAAGGIVVTPSTSPGEQSLSSLSTAVPAARGGGHTGIGDISAGTVPYYDAKSPLPNNKITPPEPTSTHSRGEAKVQVERVLFSSNESRGLDKEGGRWYDAKILPSSSPNLNSGPPRGTKNEVEDASVVATSSASDESARNKSNREQQCLDSKGVRRYDPRTLPSSSPKLDSGPPQGTKNEVKDANVVATSSASDEPSRNKSNREQTDGARPPQQQPQRHHSPSPRGPMAKQEGDLVASRWDGLRRSSSKGGGTATGDEGAAAGMSLFSGLKVRKLHRLKKKLSVRGHHNHSGSGRDGTAEDAPTDKNDFRGIDMHMVVAPSPPSVMNVAAQYPNNVSAEEEVVEDPPLLSLPTSSDASDVAVDDAPGRSATD